MKIPLLEALEAAKVDDLEKLDGEIASYRLNGRPAKKRRAAQPAASGASRCMAPAWARPAGCAPSICCAPA